jgi:DNA-binding SARP family transcriptional activator
MSALKIALLGPPEVDHRDHRLTFPDRKALALLAYLATEGGVHERQKLTRLLWPESDMAHGRTALRITLLHLRHILVEDASPECEAHLLITHDTIGLDLSSGIDLDLHALENAWKFVQVLPAPVAPRFIEGVQGEGRRTLIARLQHATALYRGGFLQDFTLRNTLDFDNWVGMQQGYWYQRIEQVFDWLSQLQSAEGALEQAIETVERWRSCDPLNEDISLRLMQLQFANSNRIAALKAYENYQDFLMRELSAKPSRKLVALAEMLRSASPRGAHNGAGRCTTTAQPLLDIPFVGRGAEVSRLMRLYEQASSGQPQVVLLEGEAGIGKTCLTGVFLDWVKAQEADVLEGRAFKTSQRLPYQPLLDSLRTRLAQEHDLRQWLGDTWLAELSRLLPELRERYPDLPPLTINGAFASSRLFEALARLSQALASRAPLLIFADDMQWMDGATLDVFQYLARHWTEYKTPAMLLLSRRTETREIDPEMSEWLASLRNSIALTRLELGPLSANDTIRIIRVLAGGDAAQASLQGECPRLQSSPQHVQDPGSGISSERFGAWLFAETNGQPFYLRALLQELLERGVLVPRLIEGGSWVFEPHPSLLEATPPSSLLPADVREMILCRLARLSSPARHLLAAGAVLGPDFTFEELCQVAQLAARDGLEALDEALQSLLLRESNHRREGGGGFSYHFADDKIREVVYAGAGDARRRVFYSRVYGPGVRGSSPRGADLELAGARQRIGSSYVSVGYHGE